MIDPDFKADDKYWMSLALQEAQLAELDNEVPVGAVIVKDGILIASGRNSMVKDNDPTGHAEVNAIRNASRALNNYRLVDCSLYVTLEPCLMCAGSLLHARIKELIFATSDPRTGACGSVFNILSFPSNHKFEVRSGMLAKEASQLLTNFFKQRR